MGTSDRLKKIIVEVLDDPSVEYGDDLSTANCGAWDSVATVRIVLSVEQEFGVRFTTAEVAEVNSVGKLHELLGKYRLIESQQ
jgi:acyl carrier protein